MPRGRLKNKKKIKTFYFKNKVNELLLFMNIKKIAYVVGSLVALSSLTNLVGYYESKAELNARKRIFDDERNPLSFREFARETAIQYVGEIDSRNKNLLFVVFGNFGAAISVDEFCDENASWLYEK